MLPPAYAHDEILGMKDSLPRSVGVCGSCDSASFLLAFKVRGAFFDEPSRAPEMVFRRETSSVARVAANL
jgi:hypothetical protein